MKNRHRLGVVLSWILVAAAAAGMVCVYPYIRERAEHWEKQNRSRMVESEVRSLAARSAAAGCAMWMAEAEKEAGHRLQPSQVFVPELESLIRENGSAVQGYLTEADAAAAGAAQVEVDHPAAEEGYDDYYDAEWEAAEAKEEELAYLTDVRGFIDDRAERWEDALEEFGGSGSVTALDENGRVVWEKTDGGAAAGTGMEEGQVRLSIAFDSMGRVSLAGAEGDPEACQAIEANRQAFSRSFDPIGENFGDEYLYHGISFSGPVNRTYEFTMDKSQVLGYSGSEVLDYYSLMNSGVFLLIWCVLAVGLGLFALVLPCLPVVSLGTGRISRTPLGIVLAALGLDAVLVLYGAPMMVGTFRGSIAQELSQILGDGSWSDAVLIGNGLHWAVTFAVVFWAALCMRGVFTIGPWRYFKERTLTGIGLRLVKRGFGGLRRLWGRFTDSLESLDWQEQSTKIILRIVAVNFLVLTVICCLWFFGVFALIVYSVILFIVLNRYWEKARKKYQILLDAINEMADGNLDVEVTEDMGIFTPFYHQLTRIQSGFKKAVQEEVKSQRMKTELVTNVSHDLKTPLTAIITYVNLLKKEDLTEEERRDYTEILEGKSMRLKALIEDLFEVSKATSGNTPLNLVDVDIVSLLKQVRLELNDRIEGSGVDFRFHLPEEKVILSLDSQKTYRVFENLLVNIVKYAMPGTRAYVDVLAERKEDGSVREVTVAMRNISAAELAVDPNELTERFVRGDEARNTEGSGLGLAIAKSFVELQGGTMAVEAEADLFRVLIRWPGK